MNITLSGSMFGIEPTIHFATTYNSLSMNLGLTAMAKIVSPGEILVSLQLNGIQKTRLVTAEELPQALHVMPAEALVQLTFLLRDIAEEPMASLGLDAQKIVDATKQ